MVFLFILAGALLIFGIYNVVSATTKDKQTGNDYFSELNRKISNTYRTVFGTESSSPVQALDELYTFAATRLDKLNEEYIATNNINTIVNTYSDLGSCGVSETHLYCGLDRNKYTQLKTVGNLRPTYDKIVGYLNEKAVCRLVFIEQDVNQIMSHLPLYAELKISGMGASVNKIALDDIRYFKIEGSLQYVSDVSGGGVNLQGAVAGALIGGGAAAVIGSQLGTETRTEVAELDSRKVTLVYKTDGRWFNYEVRSGSPEKTIAAFRKLIPQKEETAVQMEALDKQQGTSAISSADELKKFKELLDCGVISQEEFDAKKKQLLGL